jgi:two-component system chemotaxis sensor kinase CheA
MAQDPYKYFRPEARDLVDQFAKGVLELEKGGSSAAAVQRLLRVAHTLKGAARVVKQSEIANRAHAIEDALSPFREAAGNIAREQIDAILEHLDGISSQLGTLAPAEAAQDPALGIQRAKSETPEDGRRTFRADIAETDAVLDGVAEAHALLNSLRGSAQAVAASGRPSTGAACPAYGSRPWPANRRRQPSLGVGRGAVPEIRWH